MEKYTNCKTVHTGLYKPHTIYINSVGISIVYYEKNMDETDLIAIAIDTDLNEYEIYRTRTIYGNIGFLAFPVNAKKIKGFYPWL